MIYEFFDCSTSVFNLNDKMFGLVRYRNFSFIVSELVQVTPDNSRAMSALTLK